MEPSFLKKYQPKLFNEFFIDPAYIELMNTLIQMDNLNILLIGNTGCGKTSLLDAILREYYKTNVIPPYNVLYINNLQEQGISYYRNEVKTFCQITSSIPKKKKIIVLDDIDFINEQSQQVFRNCIDKYSHNVHFIISCSNTQKVIESIQSRCTLIKINPLGTNILKKIVKKIKTQEQIDITPEAESFILNICNNSIRLIINYLEKFKLLDCSITLKKAKDICTNISYFDFEKYTHFWYIDKNFTNARNIIYSIYKKGYSVMDILDSYFQFIKITDIIKEIDKYKTIRLLCKYISYFHTLHENP
ncbi:unnamed protein product, partial [marine sediment metagenome]